MAEVLEQPEPYELTIAEAEVLDLLTKAWNKFTALPPMHPTDSIEMMHSIHACQRMVMVRPSRRTMPSSFYNQHLSGTKQVHSSYDEIGQNTSNAKQGPKSVNLFGDDFTDDEQD